MSELSARLSLPYLQPSQAQKHVTHNEALERLDILVQLAVEEFGATVAPALPEAGAVHALGAGAGGAWAGHDHELAAWIDGAWHFIAPRAGWRAWGRATGELRVWDGTGWIRETLANLDGLGVNAAFDSTNRLAVSAPATLLNHEGADHRLKIGKAGPGDTASVLFQTDWSGRAELGLAGADDFSLKVSADGSTWTTAIAVSRADGAVALGALAAAAYGGEGVQQAPADTTAGRLMRADYGYGPGNLLGSVAQSGGTPTGAVIERGTNASGEYVRFADGTQICWHEMNLGSVTANGDGTRDDPYRSDAAIWPYPAAFSGAPVNSVLARVGNSDPLRRAVAVNFQYGAGAQLNEIVALRLTGLANADDVVVRLLAIGRWF